jgi:hypothetical protein
MTKMVSARALLPIYLAALAIFLTVPVQADQASAKNPPSIDISIQSTFATGRDESGTAGNPLVNGDTRFPVRLNVPIAKRFLFQYTHGYIDETLGSVTNAAGTQYYPGSVRDITDTFAMSYAAAPNVSIQAGYFDRFRVCCPIHGVSVHNVFVGANGTFGPSFRGEQVLTFSGTIAKAVAHQADAAYLASLPPGIHDQGNLVTYSGSLGVQAPLDSRHTINGYANIGIANDYFDNTYAPFYYWVSDMGLSKRFNDTFSLTGDLLNLTEHNEGYPFVFPNAIHRTKIVLTGTFHLPI